MEPHEQDPGHSGAGPLVALAASVAAAGAAVICLGSLPLDRSHWAGWALEEHPTRCTLSLALLALAVGGGRHSGIKDIPDGQQVDTKGAPAPEAGNLQGNPRGP